MILDAVSGNCGKINEYNAADINNMKTISA
jgi:hypothetical protein